MELVSALTEVNEVRESRLHRQESLQAIENELKVEDVEEKPPRKRSKKSSSSELISSFLLIHTVYMKYCRDTGQIIQGK